MTVAPEVDTGPGPEPGTEGPRPRLLARILLTPIRLYRVWLSPVLPPSCRFHPSCSAYALTAVTRHGALRGSWLTLRRLLKCAPWHPGGYDPVPPARNRPGTGGDSGDSGDDDFLSKTQPTESEQQC